MHFKRKREPPAHHDSVAGDAQEAPEAAAAPTEPPPLEIERRGLGVMSWLRLLIETSTCLVLVLAVAVAIHIVSLVSHTVLIFSLGGLAAYALDPLVETVRGRVPGAQRPRWVGVSTVFTGFLLVLVACSALLGNTLVHQVREVMRDHSSLQEKANGLVANGDGWLQEHNIPIHLQDYLDNPPDNVKAVTHNLARNALEVFAHFSSSVVEGAIVLLIALYFLIYSDAMREGIHNGLPEPIQPYAECWRADVNRILGGFVRGQLILALIMGFAAALGCLMLGVPFWLLIGFFVVLASLIPVVGPYIGAIPAVIAALLSHPTELLSPLMRAVLVVVFFVIINEAGSKVLYPRLVGAALGLHEVLVLFVLFAGYEVSGLWGVLFAAPLTALAIATVVQLYHLWQGLPPISLAQANAKAALRAKSAPDTT